MKENLTFLGIETSCDETAASVVREKSNGTGEILSNVVSSQINEHKEFGGVVPEIAARAHVEKIEFIIKKAIKESNLDLNNIAVGGWSRGGGGALKAAVLDSDIKTVLALSAWLEEVTPEELVVNAPVLFISGELDDNAANDIHTNVFYDYIPEETDKLLFEVAEGTHSTVTNPYNSYQTVGVAALHWLAEYLYYLPFCHIMAESPTTASQYITNIECEILGDINNDENLNSLDVILLLGIIVNSLEYESHANIDFDGRLNIFDLYHLIDQVY